MWSQQPRHDLDQLSSGVDPMNKGSRVPKTIGKQEVLGSSPAMQQNIMYSSSFIL